MNRLEDKDTKKFELDADYTKRHYNAVLYLTNRQVSWLTASLVVCTFFVFVAGYFLGQRKAIEQFVPLEGSQQQVHSATLVAEQVVPESLQPIEQKNIEAQDEPKQYYAQLIGFGTSRAAERFVERLQQKNWPVKIAERHSKTAQGKKIIWYQVITEQFSDKDDLIAFTKKIEKEERLNDIRIVSC